MMNAWEAPQQRCQPMGQLEYIVERQHDGELETLFVVRPHETFTPRCEELGLSVSPGCRVVFEAASMRPVGVLEPEVPEPVPSPVGYNPYFDLPPA